MTEVTARMSPDMHTLEVKLDMHGVPGFRHVIERAMHAAWLAAWASYMRHEVRGTNDGMESAEAAFTDWLIYGPGTQVANGRVP